MKNYDEILVGNNDQTKIICDHLKKKCIETEEFKNDVENSTGKTVDLMMTYIKGKARQLAKNGVAMVEDSTVFNWAFDYWHDKNTKVTNQVTEEKKPDPKPSKKPEPPMKTFRPISLFEVMNNETD